MYTQDKKNRITLRLNDNQFNFIRENSELLDVSPSEFIRMMINATMVASQKTTEAITNKFKEMETAGRENDKSNIDNIV